MSSDERRNVVLVTYDSLRADHCGCYGYGRNTTPTLDEMADSGLLFENAIASGVPTIASMTSVMTGRHSLASPEIGFNEQQREQVTSRPTIAEVLSESGYSTGALSPNPPASSYFGFDSGFDWFEDFLAEDRGVLERAWRRIFESSIEGGGLSTYLRLFRNVVTQSEVLRPWEDFYDEILAFRERAEEPYFLWVLLLEPHHPWMPPSDTQQWSSRSDKYAAFRQYWEMFDSGWTPDFSAAEHQRLIDLYDDSIRYGDQFLARLRDDLADDDPVFVVHADHGEEFGEHGRYGHQPYLYEDLTHVPLVVWNADERGRVEQPVELRQLAPTIAELGGAEHPFDVDGLLTDSEEARPWVVSKVFAEGNRRAAVRTRSGKYIEESDRRELYDLSADPDEQRDRSDENPQSSAAFGDALRSHVHDEQERRAVEAAREAVTEGEVEL
ncbi:sulfatase [Halobellus limi]|uniref:Arylsulfatase A n=1 Tax=Halobellus limi TaxID=699433 RepID=A0A1H5TWY8_9EURY|nr:sulfatase [Halobellus limi]SEF67283.1 Arylsulfatase A [Halobellus limi]